MSKYKVWRKRREKALIGEKTILVANIYQLYSSFSLGKFSNSNNSYKNITEDYQTTSTSGINITRNNYEVEHPEVAENLLIMEKNSVVKWHFLCQNHAKNKTFVPECHCFFCIWIPSNWQLHYHRACVSIKIKQDNSNKQDKITIKRKEKYVSSLVAVFQIF